jgi:hypothetical protein
MPAPVITEAPDPPLRSDNPSTFTTKAEAFVEWMASAPDEFNALGAYLEALESGTLSAKLAAIDALTWAADKLIYLTGTNTVATADLTAFGRTLTAWADAAALRTALGVTNLAGAQPWTPNFSDDGEVRFYADVAMTVTEQATSGTGTIAYEKSTNAAPTTFSGTTSPITLEAGAWLKVSASSVTSIVAVHLKRTA